jgi:hypothetical protein
MPGDGTPFPATSEQPPRRLGGVTGKGWEPGRSGNPNGRPKSPVDIAALARVHGPRCIEVAVALLDEPDSRIRLAALTALLDRGFGRPVQAIAADPATSAIGLHLLAAQTVGKQLLAERAEPRTINGHAEPGASLSAPSGQADGRIVDLLMQPPPLE